MLMGRRFKKKIRSLKGQRDEEKELGVRYQIDQGAVLEGRLGTKKK